MMRLIAPWGFYGAGNCGDEGTLSGFARLLALTGTEASVWIASRNPGHTARVEPTFHYFGNSRVDFKRWGAKAIGNAHAVVGGTPIMDVLGDWPFCELVPLIRKADRWKVPFVFIGCGIESLRRPESCRQMTEEIIPRVRHWSVRSDKDGRRLLECGVPAKAVTVAADMAWLIDSVSADAGRRLLAEWGIGVDRPLIGVNLANENRCFDEHPEMASAIARALDTLAVEREARVLFLCAEVREEPTYDKAAAQRIVALMKRPELAVIAPNHYLAPRQMMSIIACCELTMSMRYHFCLFSAVQGVPFIGIERSDKVADLCWDLEWTARVKPPSFNAGELLDHAKRLRKPSIEETSRWKDRIRVMRERALLNARSLEAVERGW